MASPTDPLEQLRVTKNAYFFNLRRKYTPVAHYIIKKSHGLNPLAAYLGATAKPKLPPRGGAARQKAEAEAGAGGPSFLSAILKTMAVFFIIIMLAGAGLILWVNANTPRVEPVPPVPTSGFIGGLEVRPLILDMLTAGTRSQIQAQPYAQFDYAARNLSGFWVDARLYSSAPSRQVFILQYPRIGDSTWPQFRTGLEENLRARGWPLSDIRIEDLRDMPGGSTLIIPTGFLPQAMLDGSGRAPSPVELASRGVSVIYIGQPMDRLLDSGGRPVSAPPGAVSGLGLNFDDSSRPASVAPWRMGAPLYTVSSKRYGLGSYYGSVSGLAVGKGFLLFVPQTLEGGWPQDGAAAAQDIATLVAEEPYRPVLSGAQWAPAASPPGSGRASLFFDPAIAPQGGILRLRFYLNDTGSRAEQLVVDWPIKKESSGDLFLDGSSILVPKYLGGGDKYVELDPNDAEGKATTLYLELEQDGQTYGRAPVGSGPVYTNIPTTTTFSADAPTGAYVLRLVDNYNRIYAATRVWVPQLDVLGPDAAAVWRARGLNYGTSYAFATGQFRFLFTSDGQPRPVPAVNVTLQGPTPSMNGAAQSFGGQDNIAYAFKRDFVRGNYTFLFDFGHDYSRSVTLYYYVRPQLWERGDVVGLGAVAAIIFALGFYVSKVRTDKLLYSLDIPDFPPQSVLKVKLTPRQVLGLFEQINRDYAWERMPLKAEELRNGFRKVNSGGKPVMIGDYNLQRILDTLHERKLVVEELGYWMPTNWLRESGNETKGGAEGAAAAPPTARRLAMFRSLRDLFVTHAVRFSKLRALPSCDVKAIIGSAEYYLHLYEGDQEIIVRALSSADAGSTWIVFKDADEREDFESSLHSAAAAPLALKLQIANRRVRLITLDELPGLLKSLKVR
ncbi:Uncharacterised protein [uncultured archaeon]|nr:Uncharacterised protein [uncultured archaeon]